jgi:hypothetical protein
MAILVSEDSNKYTHLFLFEREYFGFNTLEETAKRGDVLRTTLVLKIGLKKFLSINFHQKMSH